MATTETGHHPNRVYTDQDGDFHANGGNLYIDETGMQVVKYADTLITAAEVLAMNATPQTLVAAPGSGIALEFLEALLFIDFGTTAYTDDAGEDLVIRYTNGSGTIVSETVDGTDLDVTADALITIKPVALQHTGLTANAALVAHILTGELADGDSPFKIRTFYREVPVSTLEAIS